MYEYGHVHGSSLHMLRSEVNLGYWTLPFHLLFAAVYCKLAGFDVFPCLRLPSCYILCWAIDLCCCLQFYMGSGDPNPGFWHFLHQVTSAGPNAPFIDLRKKSCQQAAIPSGSSAEESFCCTCACVCIRV